MQELQITIQGTTPLLLHRFTDEAQMIATAGSRPSIANDAKSPQEQAEESLYLDENGVSGIPGPNVMRCLIDAGKYLKVGRTKATTQKSSLIPAAFAQRLETQVETVGWEPGLSLIHISEPTRPY